MAKGTIRCCGSSLFLKRHCASCFKVRVNQREYAAFCADGVGYLMTVSFDEHKKCDACCVLLLLNLMSAGSAAMFPR